MAQRRERPHPTPVRLSNLRLFGLVVVCGCRPVASSPPADDAQDGHAAMPIEPQPRPATEPPPADPSPAKGTIAWQHVDRATARGPGWLLGQLAPEPYRPRGRFEGWELTAVFPDAPELCTPSCDLRPGDVILSVQGDALETPDAYSAMFDRARTLTSLRVVRLREGVRETVEYRISERPLPGGTPPG